MPFVLAAVSVVLVVRHYEGKLPSLDKVRKGYEPPQVTRVLSRDGGVLASLFTERRTVVKFGDIVEGVTMIEKLDEVTGLSRKVVIESRAADLRPRVSLKHPETGETLKLPNSQLEARYLLPVGANIVVQDGDLLEPGDVVSKIPRESTAGSRPPETRRPASEWTYVCRMSPRPPAASAHTRDATGHGAAHT